MLRLPSRFEKVLVSSRQGGILMTIATVKIKKKNSILLSLKKKKCYIDQKPMWVWRRNRMELE